MDAQYYYNAGLEYYKKGQIDEALKSFLEAIKLEFEGQPIKDKVALDEPVNVFRTKMQMDMSSAVGHYQLGVIYHIKGYYINALQQYTAYLDIHPENSEVHNLLGMVHLKRKNELTKGIKQFEEALKLRPDYEEARLNLEKAKQLKAAPKIK